MKRELTTEEKKIFERFNKWTNSLFNIQPHQSSSRVPFSALPQKDSYGNIIVDRGRMVLEFAEKDGTQGPIYSIFLLEDEKSLLCSGNTLFEVLLEGLKHAIQREWVATFI